jgi:hypothetical protein
MSGMSIRELKAAIARLDREIELEQQRHAAALRPRLEPWPGDTGISPEGVPEISRSSLLAFIERSHTTVSR